MVLKEINPEYPIGRTDAEAEAPILSHLMQRSDSLEKPQCWERQKAGEGDDRE